MWRVYGWSSHAALKPSTCMTWSYRISTFTLAVMVDRHTELFEHLTEHYESPLRVGRNNIFYTLLLPDYVMKESHCTMMDMKNLSFALSK